MPTMVQTDIGSYVLAKNAMTAAVITAATGNDNTDVTGNVVDRLALNGAHIFRSCKLVIPYTAVLAAAKTLSIAASLLDSATSFSGAALVATRARHISSGGVITPLTLTAGALALTTVATDSGSGSTLTGVVEVDYNLDGAKRYVRSTIKADLNASGTDTVALSATLVFGGTDQLPA